MSEVLVKAAAVERLAVRVAELLEQPLLEALEARLAERDDGALVDAATVANALGLSRSTVYEHADELGAIRLGNGDKPRLRFDLERAKAGVRGLQEESPEPARTSRSRRTRPSTAPLLPIRGAAR